MVVVWVTRLLARPGAWPDRLDHPGRFPTRSRAVSPETHSGTDARDPDATSRSAPRARPRGPCQQHRCRGLGSSSASLAPRPTRRWTTRSGLLRVTGGRQPVAPSPPPSQIEHPGTGGVPPCTQRTPDPGGPAGFPVLVRPRASGRHPGWPGGPPGPTSTHPGSRHGERASAGASPHRRSLLTRVDRTEHDQARLRPVRSLTAGRRRPSARSR